MWWSFSLICVLALDSPLSCHCSGLSGPSVVELELSRSRLSPESGSRPVLTTERPEHWSVIRFCSSAVLLLARQSGSRAAAHLINADLTGHAAAADSQLPAALPTPPQKKKTSAMSQRHIKEIFRVSYVINWDLCERGHHAAGPVSSPVVYKLPLSCRILTAASVLATCMIIVICHVF